MANLTSSQSGNWTASSTWGGSTPTAADTFTISQGHKVTVNSDTRTGDGYGDILVRGCLHFATNGKMRMNGRITVQGNGSTDYTKSSGVSAQDFTEGGSSSGALLSGTGNNILIEFNGTNADQHGIWIENVTYSSWKFEGDTNVTTTALTSSTAVNDAYLPVSSVTGFAHDDWVAIYNEGEADYRVRTDEGCWVHDVDSDNNRIYIKKFVGPKAIISSASGTSLVVDHSNIFRVGYKIIFGEGSNLNVRTITAINNTTKTLTLDSSVSGTVSSGTEIYETGLDKIHGSGHKVRRHAANLTAAAAVGDTTIQVSDATDLGVGDTIVIDVNNDVDTNWDYNASYSITGKSGNTLTVSPAIGNIRKQHSIVMKTNRSIQIKGIDEDTRAFCYVEYYTDYNRASTREIRLKDVEWEKMGGNTGNTFYYSSVMVAGYNSRYRENEHETNSRQDFQSKYENCVVHNGNNKGSYYTGMNVRHTHGFVQRNCISFNNGHYEFWNWSSQHDLQFVNNMATRSSYSCLTNDGMYEQNEWAYCHFSRCDDYTVMFHHNREMNQVHNFIIINSEQRPFYHYYQAPNSTFKRFHIDGFRSVPYVGIGGGDLIFQDSYIQNKYYKQIPGTYAGYTDTFGIVDSNDYFGNGGGDGRANYERGGGHWMHSQYTDWNFEEGLNAVVENSYNLKWNRGGNIWDVVNLRSEFYYCGQEIVHVPANTAVTIKGEYKLGATTGSQSYPYLSAKSHGRAARYQSAYTDQTSFVDDTNTNTKNSYFYTFLKRERFTGTQGQWQAKTFNIAAQKYAYTLIAGYEIDSDNQEEIGQMRDLKIIFPGPVKTKNRFGSRTETSVSRKRISGRI